MEQQNQNVQVEEGISLMDIVRLLLTKIKLLILVVLIGGIAGGAFAVWRTVNVNYFGTKVEFYVNPEKPEESTGTAIGPAAGGSQYGVYGAYGRHVMDNMIKLLSSDSFAEKLLLNGSPLPNAEGWFGEKELDAEGSTKTKNEAFKELIDNAQIEVDKVSEANVLYENALKAKAEVVKAYSAANDDLNAEWKKLFQQGLVKKSSFNEEEYFKLTSRPASLETAYSAFVDAQNTVSEKTSLAKDAEEVWKLAQKDANAAIDPVLEYWRTSSKYTSKLVFFKNAISYSYLESDDDFEDANNLARSFIYVKISVQNSSVEKGMEVGNDLLSRVKKVVPQYVAENMTVPDGYSGTNCQRITITDNIHLTNPLYTTKQAVKYAVLVAAAAFVVACVVIIILDKSDKRLRDTEIITRKFNVPLLGIVPTIEDLKSEQNGKKKAEKTTEVK